MGGMWYNLGMKKLLGILAFIFIVIVVGIVYFYFKGESGDLYKYKGEQRDLYAQIMGAIHTRASNKSACQTIGVGARACGGPDKVLVYSTESTDVENLETLVSQFNDAKRKENEMTKAPSICLMEPTPEVDLVDGNCVAKPPKTEANY